MHTVKLGLFTLLLLLIGTQGAVADECQLSIDGNDAMAFSKKEMTAPSSCKEVTITLKHVGKMASNAMGHNWVLSKSSDFKDIATAGMAAGLDNNYLPQGDERIIAATKIIGGGESDSVTLTLGELSADEEYTFFCSFPGHWSMMYGSFKII